MTIGWGNPTFPFKIVAYIYFQLPNRVTPMKLSKLFKEFFDSERTSGLILILCTIVSLVLANSLGDSYARLWHTHIFSKPLEFWINDGLMTVFFLLVGLEIEREIYKGELSDARK